MNMNRYVINKIVSMSLVFLLMLATATNCSEDGVTYSLKDVSNRISGFGSPIVGAGANLTVTGTDLDKVVRVAVGNLVVPSRLFVEATPTSLTFPVPGQAVFGETTLLFVFPGSERATSSIEVVPLQLITSFNPSAADAGETITLLGLNFEEVGTITASVGGAPATITSMTNTVIKLTVPAGAADGTVTLTSDAGVVSASGQLVLCGSSPANPDCADALNANFSFESGDDDVFDNWGQWNGGGFVTEATAPDKVFRGERSLQVVRDGSLAPDQWRIQVASDLVDTDIGSSYTVYAWVRSTVAGGSMRFSTQPSALYGGDTPVPTTWTRISWTFTANADDTRVMMDLNGAAVTTFYIDDVKLLKN